MTKIEFSIHAERRMKLYGIAEIDIINTLNEYFKKNKIIYGKHDIINKALSEKYVYPINKNNFYC